MIFYITGSLYYQDKRLFHESGIRVSRKNYWDLNDYGWTNLDKSLNLNPYLGILDCGGDGDCLFKCIAEAYNNLKIEDFIDTEYLREIVSKSISKKLYKSSIENYKIQKQINELNGFWDPDSIENVNEFREIIKNKSFWGDYLCIEILSKKMKLNFLVLDTNFNVIFSKDKYKKTIVLICIEQTHFQLLSYFNGEKICTLLTKNQLEKSLLKK